MSRHELRPLQLAVRQCLLAGLLTCLPATAGDAGIDALDWLAGHWRGAHEGGVWEVIYSTPEAGIILGLNKEIAGDGTLRMFEFEVIAEEDGTVRHWPMPNGKRTIAFDLAEVGELLPRARFVNPEHDFPNEIVYERPEDDRLVITVRGLAGGEPLELVLDLERQP